MPNTPVTCPRPLWDALKQTLEVTQDMPNITAQGSKILTMLLFDMQCAEAPTVPVVLVSSTGGPL